MTAADKVCRELNSELLSVRYDLGIAENRVIKDATNFVKGIGYYSFLGIAVCKLESLIARRKELENKKQRLVNSTLDKNGECL